MVAALGGPCRYDPNQSRRDRCESDRQGHSQSGIVSPEFLGVVRPEFATSAVSSQVIAVSAKNKHLHTCK